MYRSVDLREAAVRYYKAGHTLAETAESFNVSKSAVSVWVQKYEDTGDLHNKPLNRGFRKIDPEKLKEYVENHPDDTQQEIADAFKCSNQAVSKALKRNGITRKKKTLRYKEQDPQKVEEYREEVKDIPEDTMAYVDETGFDTYYDREYGYAPRGEKVFGEVSGKKFKRANLVAAKLGTELVAPFQYDGTTNAKVFENWFEDQLLPALPKGTVVIMDNASFHRKNQLLKMVEDTSIRIIFLPPYSPELNPIEKVWANIKRHLRKHMRNYATFDEAVSATINSMFPVG